MLTINPEMWNLQSPPVHSDKCPAPALSLLCRCRVFGLCLSNLYCIFAKHYLFCPPMKEIDILNADFGDNLDLTMASELRAGFPSPAEDYLYDTLDFNRDLIEHPESTFYGKVKGDSMCDIGINDGDIAVIDRSRTARNGSVVVAYVNNEFTIKTLDTTHAVDGYVELVPANSKYPPIRINENDEFAIWGVVVYTIKRWT